MQATTCRISPPEHHFRLLSQVKAACVLLETVQILLLTPQLCPKKKKGKKRPAGMALLSVSSNNNEQVV